MESGDTVTPHTDWSRATRKKLALLKVANDSNQTKITMFLDLLQNVTSLIEKNPTIAQECKFKQSKENFNLLSKRLIMNAEKNLQKQPQQVRHDFLLKNLLHLYLFTVVQGPIVVFLVICLVPFHAYILCKDL